MKPTGASKGKTKLSPAVVHVAQPKNRNARGLGFVTAGEYVITAAHNLPRPKSANGIYDHDHLVVTTSSGNSLLMTPVFVDQCTDIAVLALSDANPEMRDVLDEVATVPVAWAPTVGKHAGTVATHERGLVKAVCEVRESSNRITFTGKSPFASGTSGGPVLDGKGRVMALVSQTTTADGNRMGWGPAIGECLPAWLARRIAQQEGAVASSLKAPTSVDRSGRRKKP
jgi:S1-C subfamily serine protease